MSYRDYVIAAYAVFAVFLLWDWLAPKLQLRAALRAARQRAAHQRAQQQSRRGTQQDLER